MLLYEAYENLANSNVVCDILKASNFILSECNYDNNTFCMPINIFQLNLDKMCRKYGENRD